MEFVSISPPRTRIKEERSSVLAIVRRQNGTLELDSTRVYGLQQYENENNFPFHFYLFSSLPSILPHLSPSSHSAFSHIMHEIIRKKLSCKEMKSFSILVSSEICWKPSQACMVWLRLEIQSSRSKVTSEHMKFGWVNRVCAAFLFLGVIRNEWEKKKFRSYPSLFPKDINLGFMTKLKF